jgi:sterol desaturase/sphingolipid hydroxylase (fatty acid hydroxylase superfamily)
MNWHQESLFLQIFLMHIFSERAKYLLQNGPPLFPQETFQHTKVFDLEEIAQVGLVLLNWLQVALCHNDVIYIHKNYCYAILMESDKQWVVCFGLIVPCNEKS